jgi:hypothetical protein
MLALGPAAPDPGVDAPFGAAQGRRQCDQQDLQQIVALGIAARARVDQIPEARPKPLHAAVLPKTKAAAHQAHAQSKRFYKFLMRFPWAKLTCTSTIEKALLLLNDEHFDLIIVDRHLGGWLSPQACKALVATAGRSPVVGLINEECILDLRDGIEARLRGVYYKDQIDGHLMRRLSQLAHLPSLGTSLYGASGAMA